jgi:tetraprenyl-beta-curcumene synthase
VGARATLGDRAASAALFSQAARAYWTEVFPRVSSELRRWRELAREIPNPALRAQALQALDKRGNMEGAAAFATFTPRERRAAVVRATVAFQTAYNHLDTISEHWGSLGPAEVRRLHEALLAAIAGPYPTVRSGNDSDYLQALIDTCRQALCELPCYDLVAQAAQRAAERVVSFQAFNRYERQAIEHWGQAQTPPGSDLLWWETAASGGSSLGVHVMIAAAAVPEIEPARVDALERAYFPWIGALHSMLDQLIDVEEDAHTGQPNLIELYGSTAEAAERMALLAERALEYARGLEPRHRHELIVAAMASFYLSAPQARVGEAAIVTRAVLEVFGALARPALAIFKTRRAAERVYYACREHGPSDRPAPSLTIAAGHY